MTKPVVHWMSLTRRETRLMILRCVVLAVVLGVLGVGLGACGSSSGDDQGAACTAAVNANEDNAKALCTEAADLGDSDGMVGLGYLAYTAGDKGLAESWWQKSADLGNSHAMWGLGNLAYYAED